MKPWQAPIPQTPSRRARKRCYTIWRVWRWGDTWRARCVDAGGKVVWLTDKQLTLARIKYPNMEFDEVLERDRLEEYKKYLDQTIE